jgi:hypothetical protein
VSGSGDVLVGAGGSKRRPFIVRIQSLGIKQITFYVDGHKLKTLSASQAKGGFFSVTIDPRKYGYGGHTVSVKTVMVDAACPNLARAAVFVRPHPPVVVPKFTG